MKHKVYRSDAGVQQSFSFSGKEQLGSKDFPRKNFLTGNRCDPVSGAVATIGTHAISGHLLFSRCRRANEAARTSSIAAQSRAVSPVLTNGVSQGCRDPFGDTSRKPE